MEQGLEKAWIKAALRHQLSIEGHVVEKLESFIPAAHFSLSRGLLLYSHISKDTAT